MHSRTNLGQPSYPVDSSGGHRVHLRPRYHGNDYFEITAAISPKFVLEYTCLIVLIDNHYDWIQRHMQNCNNFSFLQHIAACHAAACDQRIRRDTNNFKSRNRHVFKDLLFEKRQFGVSWRVPCYKYTAEISLFRCLPEYYFQSLSENLRYNPTTKFHKRIQVSIRKIRSRSLTEQWRPRSLLRIAESANSLLCLSLTWQTHLLSVSRFSIC